jgi:hypothetical protein
MQKLHSMTNIANMNRIFQNLVVLSALNYEFCKKDSHLMKSSKERTDAKQQYFSQFHCSQSNSNGGVIIVTVICINTNKSSLKFKRENVKTAIIIYGSQQITISTTDLFTAQ